ncbi:MAG: hypothetical protein KDC94_10870 [Aequorivita sp.]|nr:hypothetical protein [Aequorivita sp.]MCB0455318.1 hypothetical protein [Aequorivita sp.]MCB0468885.1 hypothetical protein [Aequorivita sp.]HPE82293.1 hypothetical protein [Aequorivita sp.]
MIWLLVKQTVTNQYARGLILGKFIIPLRLWLTYTGFAFVISIFREVDAIFQKLTENFFQSQY